MMGRTITDPVEAGRREPVAGIGWLPVDTVFHGDKVTRQRRGTALGHPVSGYQIHHGRTTAAAPWLALDDGEITEPEGAGAGRWLGTSLHGLFEEDGFRGAFLRAVAARRGKSFLASTVSFEALRQQQIDRVADMLEACVDIGRIEALLE